MAPQHADPAPRVVPTQSEFFRCPVQAEQGAACIRVGRGRLPATVQETSIDGFTVLVDPQHTHRMKVGKPWVLEFDGCRVEVHAQWFFHAPDGHVQVGLRRLRDLTVPDPIRSRYSGSRAAVSTFDQTNNSTLAFAGFVICLICAMAMPGLGDSLGTAKPMGTALSGMFKGLGDVLSRFF